MWYYCIFIFRTAFWSSIWMHRNICNRGRDEKWASMGRIIAYFFQQINSSVDIELLIVIMHNLNVKDIIHCWIVGTSFTTSNLSPASVWRYPTTCDSYSWEWGNEGCPIISTEQLQAAKTVHSCSRWISIEVLGLGVLNLITLDLWLV